MKEEEKTINEMNEDVINFLESSFNVWLTEDKIETVIKESKEPVTKHYIVNNLQDLFFKDILEDKIEGFSKEDFLKYREAYMFNLITLLACANIKDKRGR